MQDINDILAQYIDDPNTVVGEIVNGPFVSHSRKGYGLSVRPYQEDTRNIESGDAVVILTTGIVLPATVIGISHIHPMPDLVSSGKWSPLDQAIYAQIPGLTEEQLPLVRYFAQKQAPSQPFHWGM